MARDRSTAAAGSTPARKPRWYQQIWQVYRISYRYHRRTPLWMALAFVGAAGASFGLSYLFGGRSVLWIVISAVLAVVLGAMVALIVLARVADRAVFTQLEGQAGATTFALQQIKRGWWIEQEPVHVDPRTRDMVFRAVGRPGVVLVTEGPLPRVLRIAESEKKRHARVVSGVPVHVLHVGNTPEQVPLRKLVRRMRRLPKALTGGEVSAVGRRMQALRSNRPPVPQGIDPFRMRPDRKAVRGR
ncbi:MAG: DUF4191 domain-containing protein [Kineosporiaceae bacterium]